MAPPLQANSEPPTKRHRTMQRVSEQENRLDLTSAEAVSVRNHNIGQELRSCERGVASHRTLHLYSVAQASQHLFSCEACTGKCIGWHEHDKQEKRNLDGSPTASSLQRGRHNNTTRSDGGLAQPQLESGQFNANISNHMETRRKNDPKKKRSKHFSTSESQGPVKRGVEAQSQLAEYKAFLATRSTDFIKGADDIRKGWP